MGYKTNVTLNKWVWMPFPDSKCSLTETRIEIEGNGSDDSWEAWNLGYRTVQYRANHVIYTENPGHEEGHQELGPGDGEN